jgi:hypothetical protein
MRQALGAFALIVFAAAATAEDSPRTERGYRADYADQGYHRSAGPSAKPSLALATGERAAIARHYAVYFAQGLCPPGLAREAGACVPPGQAKRFALGEALAGDVVPAPLPPELAARLLAPPGHGFFYLDGHVLLVAAVKRIVVDAMAVSAPPAHADASE